MRGGTGIVRSLGVRALKRLMVAGAALCALLAVAVVPAASAEPFEDFSGPAYQILPPGAEGGAQEGKYARDQAKLYERLTGKRGKVSQETIEKDFLPEKFGVNTGGGVLRIEKPEAGLEIVRDKHDIPHITGATRGEAMFGSGWVAAKDRGLLLALGLGPAYTAALASPASTPSACCSKHARSNRAKKRVNTSKARRSCWKKRAPKAHRSSPTSKTGSTASTPMRTRSARAANSRP